MKLQLTASACKSSEGSIIRLRLFALLCVCMASMALGASTALAAGTYGPGVPASLCSGTGAGGGECGEIKSVAVDQANGNVYLLDAGNFRVNQFNAAGTFVRAFGVDVVSSGPHQTGTAAEVCEPSAGDVCKAGPSAGGTVGGAIAAAGRGIAVDSQTHIVYIVTAISRLAYYNGTTGAYIGQTEGDGSNSANAVPPPVNFNAPEKFAQATGVAVDNATVGGPYLYVSITTGANPNFRTKIDKFQAAGAGGSPSPTYICQITGTATATSVNNTECGGNGVSTHKDGEFSFLLQGGTSANQMGGNLAVDAGGNVYISESPNAKAGTPPGRHVVSVFDKAGDFVKQFLPSGAGLSATEPRPEALAILPSGNLLLSAGAATGGVGGNRIQEYDPTSVPAGLTSFTAIPRTEFSLPSGGGSLGLAGYETSLYIGDKVNKKALKYTQVPAAPDVLTGAATAISKFKATVNGTVNPSFGNITDCHFEYLTDAAYQANAPATRFAGATTAPCVPTGLGSGNNPVTVSAKLAGLQGATTYHVRVVATNSVATTPGNEATFATGLFNEPEAITTPGATAITQSAAKVAGKVNPNEVQITDCHFEYGTTTAYGSTAPCAPNAATIGAGENLVDVSASLSGLSADTTYHFLLKATNGDGTSTNTDDQTFKTLPSVPLVSDVSAEAGQVGALVKAKVNPNSGPNASLLTSCRIDYGTTSTYGSTKPCTPSPGPGSSPVDVSFSLSGLSPGTLYFYRVVASNAGGSNEEAKSFLTLAPNRPTAFSDGSSEGSSDTFILEGRVDPEGIALTDCHFAYGVSAEYEKTAPCAPSAASIGAGNEPVAVTAATEPLEPGTIYHFRLFASNVRGNAQGKELILKTGSAPADSCKNAAIRADQGIEVVRLPDCLALEQASPSKKGNQSARLKVGGDALSPDGDRVLFNSAATLGNCPNVNGITGDGFIAIRKSGSWGSECVTPPVDAEFANSFGGLSFDPGLSSWLQLILTTSGERKFFRSGIGVPRVALSPDLVNLTGSGGPGFMGASADHSHLFLSPQGDRQGSFLPGDPVPTGVGEDPNLYVAHRDSGGTPSLQLATKDLSNKVWGGNCGARLGGMETTTGGNLNLQNGRRNQGAISTDGTRSYLSTRPSQPEVGACTEANKKRILVREETPGGVEIEELFASECTRVAPACSATDGDDVYQGASVDQNLVYFTTTRQLADADLDSSASSCDRTTAVSGCDLYLYDDEKPAGEKLIDVSAGESTAVSPGTGASVRNSITAISGDGSHAYFVARTVLTTDPNPGGAVAQPNANNLYLFTYPDEELAFVGTLAPGDSGALFGGEGNWENGAYAVPTGGSGPGGDGHVLLFNSQAQLDPADTDPVTDLYRYDAEEDSLELLSAAAVGGSGNGAFGTTTSTYLGEGPGTDYADSGRWVSEDGNSIAFTTREALFPGDTNDAEDAYLWRDGQLYHLPGSSRASAGATPIRPIVSRDGQTIAYHSTKRLTASDIDSVEDVYVLRPEGGFPTASKEICQAEACTGPPQTPPAEPAMGTEPQGAPGNVKKSPIRSCPKGKHKVRRDGKVRCVRNKKHRNKHNNSAKQKRTSFKQGVQK